jgi:hypothetical protein
MNQLSIITDDLFSVGDYGRIVHTPAARNTDPITSHLAAEHVTKTGTRQNHVETVIRTVRSNPGLTSFELAAHCGLERHEVARTTDAETAGAIHKGSIKRQANGRSAVTWWPV